MQTGISTLVDLSLPIDELSRLIAAAGFTHISLCHDVKHAGYHKPKQREHLRKLWDGLGIGLNYIHPPLECYHDLTSLDGQVRRGTVEMMKLTIDATADLGGEAITIHMANDYDLPIEELPARVEQGLESLHELGDYAREHKVVICIENLPLVFAFGPLCLEVIRRTADQPEFKVCLDSCHATMGQKEPLKLVRELAPRVLATHFSDTMGEDDSHLIPGEGNVDFPGIMRELGQGGFNGVIDLECSLWMLRKRHDRGDPHSGDPVPCSTEHYLERAHAAAVRLHEQLHQARAGV